MEALVSRLNEMRETVEHLMERLDLAGTRAEIEKLETEAASPTFWDNPRSAQTAMQRLSRLKEEAALWEGVSSRIKDALELAELEDESLEAELTTEVDSLAEVVHKLNFEAMMSGKYDQEDAILSIHAGAGGTESQDWASMLLRMFLRWAESHKMDVEIIDQTDGEEAGIKSATLTMKGAHAYGYLQSERGVHRLVRISPFDANKRRHTSFALVEVVPDVQGDINIEINESDLEIDYYRSSGAGGQHVQKNETAVRIVHKPTGMVVTCQNERSQLQNRERAMQVLKARLFDLERRKQEEEFAQLKGDHVAVNFGSQIRSYVLHPYQMVKDHRTDYESGNTGAVLDGRLDEFMEAYLRAKVGQS
ncbi:MAG: peptide chain release factor 2 [Anaerolinea sp.]|nr:peptide chain release factor 2 [Anaerolinea sp.]MCC6975415.1 peptide chain release factor 2 [Anaerolineae bacterium]